MSQVSGKEIVINESIKALPMALLRPERARDLVQHKQIDVLCRDPEGFFVKHLSEGVATITMQHILAVL